MNKKEKLERYLEIKDQIRELETEMDALKSVLFDVVFEEDGGLLEFNGFEFKTMYRPKYKFSSDLTLKEIAIKDKLKHMKTKEINEGVAIKITDGGYLIAKKIEIKKEKTGGLK